ncbi:MAG: MGMT family protein [Microcella sp.]|uniref:MGMT family protein n=1 Tax=Microcella sp. TaxID=1913979 RepID=UPI0024C525AA|nr:MGMT family protein [Microcella sp.]UYN83378.1 MAG: MGMT family protein [Microcella sp.]
MPSASAAPDDSLDRTALDFGAAVLLVVDRIPTGRVMTYGDVAAELGSRGARAVGRVMAMEGSSVCWWRVVRADGRPPAGHERAALEHYLAEGTPVRSGTSGELDYRLDLAAARWAPWRDDDPPTRTSS